MACYLDHQCQMLRALCFQQGKHGGTALKAQNGKDILHQRACTGRGAIFSKVFKKSL